jgi:hypothetical protein
LKHEHWKVRQMTADLLGQFAPILHDRALLRRTARMLWWRLTDQPDVARTAFQALERVVNHCAALTALT